MMSNLRRSVWLFGAFLLAVGCSDCGSTTDPVAAEIQFVGDRTSLENTFNATFKFEVRLDASNQQEVRVDYQTVEGTALEGDDYEPQSGTLVFAPGDLIHEISIPIVIDEALESDEQFKVVLSNPINGYLKGNIQEATGTILNDDTQLVITLPEGGYDTPHSPDVPPEGMALVWSDEFEGELVDQANWMHELGGNGWGNNELQTYTSDASNSFVEDGNLFIVSLENGGSYTSARLKSQDLQEFQYGRIDVRAVLPYGQGVWPAIWMLGGNFNQVGWPECGEIDIMELVGHQPNFIHGTAHWGEIIGGGHPSYGTSTYSDFPTTFSDEYHVFSLEWSADTMRWLMNGEPYHLVTSENVAPYDTPFNSPFFFILNVAVGGNWPGYPDESTMFPQFMAIDYVRVYQ
ncbi:MAG: family 16 glycosylhydrolase [Flavobacteriales bacterium]|nr:family 16 glycosylhydrolase [Flavobacteriales bacterium]